MDVNTFNEHEVSTLDMCETLRARRFKQSAISINCVHIDAKNRSVASYSLVDRYRSPLVLAFDFQIAKHERRLRTEPVVRVPHQA